MSGLLFVLLLGLGFVSAVWPAVATGAETARGFVFDDRDGDGIRGDGEAGVPDVRVSNGRDVVTTDDTGAWTLSVEEGDVVFVTKPSGWATPVGPDMLPRFYYIHQPSGSPTGLRHPGVPPTGPLPASIDFPLRRQPEPERFEAILFADTQPQTEVELDWLRDDVVAPLIGTQARFGMTLGDILFDDLSLFPRYVAIVSRIGVPWYNVPGNHELNFDATDDATSLETFKRWFGPPYYSFEVGRAVFYVLDDIEYQGGGQADPADYRGNGGYEAAFGKRQLRWLERDLAHVPDDRLVFLAMHAPLETYLAPEMGVRDRRRLFDLLEGREHLYAVAGHTHTTEHHYFGVEDGFSGPGELHHHVLATVSGSWWSGPLDARGVAVAEQRDGTPNGYHVLEIDGDDVTVGYRAAGAPADHQMRILVDADEHHHRPEALRQFRHGEQLDGRLSVDQVPAARIVVNLFDGGPRSEVSFSVDGGPARPMARRAIADPHTRELYTRHPEAVKPWVEAVASSHVFVADLPDALGPGTYTLTVRARDEFGRLHHGHSVLEIEGSSAVLPPPSAQRPAPDR